MISFTHWHSFQGVTSPVFCKVSQSCVFSWTHSSWNQDLALAAPPHFLIKSFLKIWKCQARTQTWWENQFTWPSCHCCAISKLTWVWDNPLRWRVASWIWWDIGWVGKEVMISSFSLGALWYHFTDQPSHKCVSGKPLTVLWTSHRLAGGNPKR